jgi:Nif-specific regulatory protein
MRRLFAMLDKVIDTRTSVLIQGETGTGKELIAKVIHYMGPLKNKPFVAENCGAFAENLLESELFGHVKGAFTGALTNKKGLFELADGGTVFLDEISETSAPMQVKLLRVLQERQIRPVGGDQATDIDIRLIASTNMDLEAEMKNGNFRRDLFYRINVFPIYVPPLRKRREDIPLLASHFLDRYAKNLGSTVTGFTSRAMEYLSRFNWPGNVRELENEIERAVTLAGKENKVKVDHLSEKITSIARQALPAKVTQLPLKEATERIERQMVTNALQQAEGNRSQAANLLGLSRQGLLNKIDRYNIKV